MMDPTEGIFDLYNEMRKDGFATDKEKVQVYVGPEIWDEISKDVIEKTSLVHSPTDGFIEQVLPGESGEPGDMTTQTVHTAKYHGMTVIEEPHLDDDEVLMMDVGGFEFESKSPQSVVLRHPVCIQRHHFVPTKKKERCQECGVKSDTCVEGDDGELYCTIACLNEAYNG